MKTFTGTTRSLVTRASRGSLCMCAVALALHTKSAHAEDTYAAISPTNTNYQRLVILKPGESWTVCVKGRWRIRDKAGFRRWVGGAGYDLDTKVDLSSDQIFFAPGFASTSIPRLSLVYRAITTYAAANSVPDTSYYEAAYADAPDNNNGQSRVQCADKSFAVSAGTTIALEFVAADIAGAYGTHETDSSDPLSVTTNLTTPIATTDPRDYPRIDKPSLERLHTYSSHKFQPGDRIVVDAGGCVHTVLGWRPFVQPLTPSITNTTEARELSRRFYGTIWIPGATPGPIPIASVLGRTLTVPTAFAAPNEPILRIGYADFEDHYALDDYNGPLPGGECTETAWVKIRLGQASETSPEALDLTWTAFDDNWIPDTPLWWWQLQRGGGLPDYQFVVGKGTKNWQPIPDGSAKHSEVIPTTQAPTLDYNDTGKLGICEDGPHINWYMATYAGPIYWMSHAPRDPVKKGDDDYNMKLLPQINGYAVTNGLTLGNSQSTTNPATPDAAIPRIGRAPGLLLEFQANETVDEMSAADGGWWLGLKAAVDEGEPWTKVKALVDGQDAIASGLMGVDCEHDCQTELHPVWALAIHERPNPTKPNEDRWAIFVKTFGNEGGCSAESPIPPPLISSNKFSHYLDLVGNRFTMRIPIPWLNSVSTAGTKFLLHPTQNGNNASLNVQPERIGSEMRLVFDFGGATPDRQRPIVYGELVMTRQP